VTNNDDEFDTFFRKHLVSVVQHLVRLGFTRECAEEATESTMVTLYERWDKIDKPLPWVRCTAGWRAFDARQELRNGPVELTEEMGLKLHHHDSDPIERQESAARVQRLLGRLPERQRQVISWWLDGFSDQEIAEALGISEATVRSNRRHGLRKLQGVGDDD